MESLLIETHNGHARVRFSHHAALRLRQRFTKGRPPLPLSVLSEGWLDRLPPSWVVNSSAEQWLVGDGWALPLQRIDDGWLAITALRHGVGGQ